AHFSLLHPDTRKVEIVSTVQTKINTFQRSLLLVQRVLPRFNPDSIIFNADVNEHTARIYLKGETVWAPLEDVARGTVDGHVLSVARGMLGIRYLYSCPVRVNNKIFGALVYHMNCDVLTPSLQTVCEGFANELGLSFENALLQTQVHTDELTGIYNRRYFFEMGALELERTRDTGRPLSLIVFDIDNFKSVNDQHGHLAGDRILCEVARRTGIVTRRADMIARYGGEEFVVLLPGATLDAAYLITERLRDGITKKAFRANSTIVEVTVSLGVAAADHSTADIAQLFDRADRALYRAKNSGRNRISVAGRDIG
ncbi:MAG: GGDEF domain-containing protein, partial [Thermaerobacterales bacterium]